MRRGSAPSSKPRGSRRYEATDADLDAITEYYSDHSPAAGSRLLDAIFAKCRQLANQPRQGRDRSDLGAGLRSVAAQGYLIFFRATATGVGIARVLHGARDVTPDMFDE